MAASVKRPATCGALALTSPELGSVGCKRLPRHAGDHRATLKRPAVKRAASPKGKVAEVDAVKALIASLTGKPEAEAAVKWLKAYVKGAASPKGKGKGKVKVVKAAPEPSRVQVMRPAKRRGNVYVTSGQPSARLA